MAELDIDEADFTDWLKNGAVGWGNAENFKTTKRVTQGAPGAYKKAIREGQWVGNAKVKTPEEQPNRLSALLSATDPYSSTYRDELQELINDTLRYTAGTEDPGLFREIFEALTTDPKWQSQRKDFMLFLDESYRSQGLSANVMEGLVADVREGKWELTPEIRKQLNDAGYLNSEIDEMRPAYIRSLLADIELGFITEGPTSTASGPRVTMPQGSPITEAEIQQLRDLGYKDATIENMKPADIRAALRGELAGQVEARPAAPEPESEELTTTEKQRFRTLAKTYVEQGATPEEAIAKAQETTASNRAVKDTPLPRDAEGKLIEPGKFKNQKDRQTTQSAIRREGIFETSGRNWNNNRIADMLRWNIASKRTTTSEEYWQTRGDTYVSETIGTQGLRRGIEDKYLDPKNFDLVSARIQGDENLKANHSSSELSEEYGRILDRFNERVEDLLQTGELAPESCGLETSAARKREKPSLLATSTP